jgi:AraC family transcriptional regulator
MSRDILSNPDARIRAVMTYIEQHLDDELSLPVLSREAAFSKYHFHRVFLAYTGVSAVKYIQLLRLRRASYSLAFEPQKRVIDIALASGFDTPEAFSKAFKRIFGQMPSQFRSSPEWSNWHSKFKFNRPFNPAGHDGENSMDVRIVNFAQTPVALIEHTGPADCVLECAGKFIAWRKETGLSPVKTSQTFGIPYSDPHVTEPEAFRFDICGSMAGEVPDNNFGVKAGVIPGGRCAVVRHFGSHAQMDPTIYALYRDWLPQSGETLRDFPCFFEYINLIHEVDEADLLTDIYLPLA